MHVSESYLEHVRRNGDRPTGAWEEVADVVGRALPGRPWRRERRRSDWRAIGALVLGVALLCLVAGCSTQRWATLRSAPRNTLSDQFGFDSGKEVMPSLRTMQLLRLYHLDGGVPRDLPGVVREFQAVLDREPSLEKLYALAELNYLAARKAERDNPRLAMDLYGASVLSGYQYLFDSRNAREWNPYDPQFRGACDLYNGSLEAALRLVCAGEGLKPGRTYAIQTAAGGWDVRAELRGGRWKNEDFDHFKFVSDYELNGLRNQYRTYGLGVPLIAVRKGYPNEPATAKFYPVDLSFPVTALLRPEPGGAVDPNTGAVRRRAVLELYDPLTITDIAVGGRHVKLESDLSTPLAFFLSQPELETLATVGLLRPEMLLRMRPDRQDTIMGLYMLQPYEPEKIPVLFVHGLWSSPVTWMQMFNDLRNSPEIREHYQFWFYLYPTGEPFLNSATQMRRDLAEARRLLDPRHENAALDQMVLVGHSMGGLVSRLQTVRSGDNYWRLVSDRSFHELQGSPEAKRQLADMFYFEPNPAVRRVITIGTPHRGSKFSNSVTQWMTSKLITLPKKLLTHREELVAKNQKLFRDQRLLTAQTSIDSLSPESPVFPVLLASHHLPAVRYHNVIGVVPKEGIFGRLAAGTDGVVARESAHLDDAASELVVEADHTTVHAHPLTVLEVRRILLENLAELRDFPHGSPGQVAQRPATMR